MKKSVVAIAILCILSGVLTGFANTKSEIRYATPENALPYSVLKKSSNIRIFWVAPVYEP